MHRLRGELAVAEQRTGRPAGGPRSSARAVVAAARARNGDVAVALIRRALAAATEPLQRARLLPAYVETLLAAGDARGGSQRLRANSSDIAAATSSDVLGAIPRTPGARSSWPAVTPVRAGLAPSVRRGGAARCTLRGWSLACAGAGLSGARRRGGRRARTRGGSRRFRAARAAPDLTAIDALTRPRGAGGRTRAERARAGGAAPGGRRQDQQARSRRAVLSEHTVDRHVRTSSPSSTSRRGPPPPPSPSPTISSDPPPWSK